MTQPELTRTLPIRKPRSNGALHVANGLCLIATVEKHPAGDSKSRVVGPYSYAFIKYFASGCQVS